MEYGLEKNIIDFFKSIVNKYGIEMCIFGSRARGDYKVNSDIDIAIMSNVSKEVEYKIMNEIDLLDIQYKIDLVFVQKINNENFLESIKKEGKRI